MVRIFGRSKHTVRMPKQSIKEGFKIFAKCQCGYTYNWLYSSHKTGIAELPPHPTLAPTQAAVRQLALSLSYKDYDFNIYMNNLFKIVPLLLGLRDRGIGGTGTMRSNAFPRHLRCLDATTKWNTVSGGATADGKVLGLEWRDQKTVQMLMQLHPLSSVSNGSGPSLQVRVRVGTEPCPDRRSGSSINPNCQSGYGSIDIFLPV